jgi:hypothetical protein
MYCLIQSARLLLCGFRKGGVPRARSLLSILWPSILHRKPSGRRLLRDIDWTILYIQPERSRIVWRPPCFAAMLDDLCPYDSVKSVKDEQPWESVFQLTESKLWMNQVHHLSSYKSRYTNHIKMARTKPPQVAVQPSKGSKITFGDDDNEDLELDFDQEPKAGPSKRTRRQPSSEPESDDDEAPEAVGVSKSAVEDDSIASAAEALAQYVSQLTAHMELMVDNRGPGKKRLESEIRRLQKLKPPSRLR